MSYAAAEWSPRGLLKWIGNQGSFRSGGRVGVIGRIVVALQVVAFSAWLWAVNVFSRRPVTGSCIADVSLTSYGRRVDTVWLTLESIGRGKERPQRLILWLEDQSVVASPPKSLRRLIRRGLEVRYCQDYGPHKKYFPYLLAEEVLSRTLVTADDDMLYPRRWLADLVAAHRDGEVTAYRARVRLDAPYQSWPLCTSDEASDRVFATGVSGVAYPPVLLSALRERGDAFMGVCPYADDFWLHFAAIATGVRVRQVASSPCDWWPQLSLAGTGLWPTNLSGGQNDAISVAAARAWGGKAIRDGD